MHNFKVTYLIAGQTQTKQSIMSKKALNTMLILEKVGVLHFIQYIRTTQKAKYKTSHEIAEYISERRE